MTVIAEYIWVDGTRPTAFVRSKTKIIPGADPGDVTVSSLPVWAFDGSSTNQAEGADSDCILKPVRIAADPIRGQGAFLVMCEVYSPDGSPHPSNKRAALRELMENGAADAEPWIAFEQEYTFFEGSRPLGFPAERRYPAAQGPYYCGVGSDEVYGREVVEEHMRTCLAAGINLTGINAEVMPGQWEFQCGGPRIDPLRASDDLWLARWLLYRIGEDHGIAATLDPKPVPGDWNGAGMHANFSTVAMRSEGGDAVIEAACEALGERTQEHLDAYGAGNEARLTGAHETCSFREFRYGIADRTASIRIPRLVAEEGRGYLEDRRPAANADPYDVCTVLLKTTLGLW